MIPREKTGEGRKLLPDMARTAVVSSAERSTFLALADSAIEACIRCRILTCQDFSPEALHVLRDIVEDMRGKDPLEQPRKGRIGRVRVALNERDLRNADTRVRTSDKEAESVGARCANIPAGIPLRHALRTLGG